MCRDHLQSGCEHHLVTDSATSMSPCHFSPLLCHPPLVKLCTLSTVWHPRTPPNADVVSIATGAILTPCPHLHEKKQMRFFYKQEAEKPRRGHAMYCWAASPVPAILHSAAHHHFVSLHNSPQIMQTSQTSQTPDSPFRLVYSTCKITGCSYIYPIAAYISILSLEVLHVCPATFQQIPCYSHFG